MFKRLVVIAVVVVIAAIGLVFVTQQTEAVRNGSTQSANASGAEISPKKQDAKPALPNYDIRTADGDGEALFIQAARSQASRNASSIADIRDNFVAGEQALKARVPGVKFVYNKTLGIPEVITPDVWQERVEFLSEPSTEKRSRLLRGFVKENSDLVGLDNRQADLLKVATDLQIPPATSPLLI